MAFDPVSGVMMVEQLTGITAEMTGLSMAEAWQQQGFQDPVDAGFGVDFGVGIHTTGEDKPAITGDTNNSIISSNQDDSLAAFEEYEENNPSGISSTTGGAVEGSLVTGMAYSLMQTNPQVGESFVKAVAPVAVPIDYAYTAIAQTLGVSMDAAELDVETKQAFANSIVNAPGLVYDKAKGLVKAWWDGVQILFPKSTVDTVSQTINELGLGDPTGYDPPTGYIPTTINPPVLTTMSFQILRNGQLYFRFYCSAGVTMCVIKGSVSIGHVLAFSRTSGSFVYSEFQGGSPNSYSLSYTGETAISRTPFYYIDIQIATEGYEIVGPVNNVSGTNASHVEVATILYDGHALGRWLPGTSASDAPSYDLNDLIPPGEIAVSPTDTLPVIPSRIPDNPLDTVGDTNDPLGPTDQDNVDTLPAPPIPLPAPDTAPSNPDVPLSDPTTVNPDTIKDLVDQLAETLDPLPPQPSGIIPPPPLPGIVDPTTGESSYPSIIPASGPGLIHVYNPTPAEFVSFGQWLWVTYADATIDKIWANPFDGIIGAFELYATPETSGTDNIRSGFLTCPTTAALIRQRYIEMNCGSIIVPEFYGNYLDYSPYSQAYIYLPFIGINEVSVDDIVGHAINIRYRIDTYNGSCIAMIYVAKKNYRNLCYQFAGNCAVEVPLAGGSQAAIKAGVMQAEAYARSSMWSTLGSGVSNALTGLGTAGLAGLGFGLIGALGSAIGNYANAQAGMESARVANKASVQHSGQFGASHGAMGEKVPFIMIRNPIQVKVVNYNEEYGYPAHKRVIVGGCTGFLRCQEVHVISAHATDKEKAAIESMLKSGVYVT